MIFSREESDAKCKQLCRMTSIYFFASWLQARRGLDRGFKPELSLEGTGGTYFLQDAARQKVAVFKPHDEEPFAPNNPRLVSSKFPRRMVI